MKLSHLRWIVAALLFLSTAINYADRLTLSIVSRIVRGELRLSEQDYSYVLTAFMIAYAIMYAGSGIVLDRLGTRRGFAVFMFAWSGAQMFHGLVSGIWSLGAARFLLGLAEPGAWPAAAKAIAEWFPARQRALAMGIFNAGSSFGSALAPPMVALVTHLWGWRAAFLATGAFGLVWLLLWLLFYDSPRRSRWLKAGEAPRTRQPCRGARVSSRPDWRRIITRRECYTLILARFFTDPVIYFVIFWLPEYLGKERGFNLAEIGPLRVGAVPVRRYRLPARRLAVGAPDAGGVDAAEVAQADHGDRRRSDAGRHSRASGADRGAGDRGDVLRHLRPRLLGGEPADSPDRSVRGRGRRVGERLHRHGRRDRRRAGEPRHGLGGRALQLCPDLPPGRPDASPVRVPGLPPAA